MQEKSRNMLFDILYNLIWVKNWILLGSLGISAVCFLVYVVSSSTVNKFNDIAISDNIAEVSGIVEEWDYHRGGSKSGTEHLSIKMNDGKEYYLLNNALDKCIEQGLLESIRNGDIVELHIFDSGTNYSPRVYAISVNGISYLSCEKGISIYAQEAEIIAGENQGILVLGVICMFYPIIVFCIRKLLDR